MRETWIQSLGWEDPLKKGKATHSSILSWRIPWTVYPWGRKEPDTTERLSLSLVLSLLVMPDSVQLMDRAGALPGSSIHEDSSGKNTGVGCHAVLQGIFPTREQTQSLALQEDSLLSEPPGKSVDHICVGLLLGSYSIPWSVCLRVGQYHTVFITKAL